MKRPIRQIRPTGFSPSRPIGKMTDPLMPALCRRTTNTWMKFDDVIVEIDSPIYNNICLISSLCGILGSLYQVRILFFIKLYVRRYFVNNLDHYRYCQRFASPEVTIGTGRLSLIEVVKQSFGSLYPISLPLWVCRSWFEPMKLFTNALLTVNLMQEYLQDHYWDSSVRQPY